MEKTHLDLQGSTPHRSERERLYYEFAYLYDIRLANYLKNKFENGSR